jgi:hypothetical protein
MSGVAPTSGFCDRNIFNDPLDVFGKPDGINVTLGA